MGAYKDSTLNTRQNIIDAFWELYCEKRIEKITIRDIVEKAGYNRSTFYVYFTDIYDVLDQIEQSILPTLEEMPPISIDANDMAFQINSIIGIYEKHNKYYTVLLGNNGDSAFAGKLKNSIKSKLLELLNDNGSVIDEKSKIEIDYALEYLLSATVGVLAYWFNNGKNIPKEELVKLVYELASKNGFDELALKLQL